MGGSTSGEDVGGHELDGDGNGHGDEDEVVQPAQDRDEVGDEVERD